MSATSGQLRRILVAYAVNELGTWLGYVGLAVAVYDHTRSALATAALFVAGRLFPAPLVPALVARFEASRRRAQLSMLYALEALLTAGLAFAVWQFWLPAVLTLAAVDGAVALAASALLRAAAARTATSAGASSGRPLQLTVDSAASRRDHAEQGIDARRRAANARMNLVMAGSATAGPACAGLVVAAAGSPLALAIDAVSFVVCSGALLREHATPGDAAVDLRASLAEAWRHVSGMVQLRSLLCSEAAALVFFASVTPVEVLYARMALHTGNAGYGLLLAFWGAGMVFGGIVFARARRLSLGPLVIAGSLAGGIAYLGMAAAPTLSLACTAAVVGGAGNGVQSAAFVSAVQLMTPARLLGRLMAAVEAIGSLCPALGFVLGGVVAASVSTRCAFVVAGAGAIAASLALAHATRGGLKAAEGSPEEAQSSGLVTT